MPESGTADRALDFFRERFGLDVAVLRPPVFRETEPAETPPDLPQRYLLHVGKLTGVKGTPTSSLG